MEKNLDADKQIYLKLEMNDGKMQRPVGSGSELHNMKGVEEEVSLKSL